MMYDILRYYNKIVLVFFGCCLISWILLKVGRTGMTESHIASKIVLPWNSPVNKKPRVLKYPRIAVILSATHDKDSLFPLPVSAAAWQRLNVEPIVIIVGTDTSSTKQHHTVTVELLQKLRVTIHYIQNTTIPATTLAQTSRLFVAALPFADMFDDTDIFITSDADIVPIHLTNHIPNVDASQRLLVYDAHCQGFGFVPPARGSNKMGMYSMTTIGATVSAWREIMGTNRTKFDSPSIENYLKAEFGQDYFSAVDKNSEPLIQFADRSLCTYKIKEWLKIPENKWFACIKRECPRRIDGNTLWLTSQEWQELNLYRIDDVRIPPKAYKDEQWNKLCIMIDRVFSDKKFDKVRELFIKYRNDFASLS